MKAFEDDELRDIEGTEKQVQWATRLRSGLIGKLTKGETGLSEPDVDAVRAALLERTEARFWIDNRDGLVDALLGKTTEAPATAAADPTLPELSGTEKQASWAGRIRDGFLRKLSADKRASFDAAVRKQERASWWIDNRDRLEEALGGKDGAGSKGSKAAAIGDLPELEGTEKQVSWAERIRSSFVASMSESEAKAWKKTIARLKEATFWIDHRDDVREGIQSEIAEPGSSKKLRDKRFSSSWE